MPAIAKSSTYFSPHTDTRDAKLMGDPVRFIATKVFGDISKSVRFGFTYEEMQKTSQVFDSIIKHLDLSLAAFVDRDRVSRLNALNIDSAASVDLDLVIDNELKKIEYTQAFDPFTSDPKTAIIAKRSSSFQTSVFSYAYEKACNAQDNFTVLDKDLGGGVVQALSLLGRLENFSNRFIYKKSEIPIEIIETIKTADSYEPNQRVLVIAKMFRNVLGVASVNPLHSKKIALKAPEGSLKIYMQILKNGKLSRITLV